MKSVWQRNLVLGIGLISLWQACITVGKLPPFILPSPQAVLAVFIQQAPLLLQQTLITFTEICGGMLLGALSGFSLAIVMDANRFIRFWLHPLLLISQAIPTFAIAPILVFWLGYGLNSKLIIIAFMILFPVASNLFDGLQRVPDGWLDLAKSMNASRWQTLRHIRLPAALPALASGLRIAAAAAPLGAVVGEWVGASQGLGFLMLEANARLQIDMMFAALFILIVLAISFYFGIDKLLRRFISWEQSQL